MRDDHWIPVIHPLIHAGLMTYMCFTLVNRTDSDDHLFSQNHRRVTKPKVYTFPGWWFVRHYVTYTTWPPPWFARMIFTHPTCNQWFIGIRIGFTMICPNREGFPHDTRCFSHILTSNHSHSSERLDDLKQSINPPLLRYKPPYTDSICPKIANSTPHLGCLPGMMSNLSVSCILSGIKLTQGFSSRIPI